MAHWTCSIHELVGSKRKFVHHAPILRADGHSVGLVELKCCPVPGRVLCRQLSFLFGCQNHHLLGLFAVGWVRLIEHDCVECAETTVEVVVGGPLCRFQFQLFDRRGGLGGGLGGGRRLLDGTGFLTQSEQGCQIIVHFKVTLLHCHHGGWRRHGLHHLKATRTDGIDSRIVRCQDMAQHARILQNTGDIGDGRHNHLLATVFECGVSTQDTLKVNFFTEGHKLSDQCVGFSGLHPQLCDQRIRIGVLGLVEHLVGPQLLRRHVLRQVLCAHEAERVAL